MVKQLLVVVRDGISDVNKGGAMRRFIHTADIHLDSPLRGLSSYEGAPLGVLRDAPRAAFHNLVDAAIEEKVDFMVIAGDLYDGSWRDYNTGLFFISEMGRLHKASIPVYLLYGNHDAESEITKNLTLPANVHRFSAKAPQTFKLESIQVALHGQSFRQAATTDNLAKHYPPAESGYFNIGVLHTALQGHEPHANYAPCSVAELRAKEYDYWALGHVHEASVLSEKPHIVFPGNLQGRHIREPGPRGALLVTENAGSIDLSRLDVDVLRWHHLRVDVAGSASFEDVIRQTSAVLGEAYDRRAGGKPMAIRVSFTGRSSMHGQLFGMERHLRAEVLGLAASLAADHIWIEKVLVDTEPELDPKAMAGRSDALAELQQILARSGQDAEFLDGLGAELQDLLARLPRDVQDQVPQLEAIRKTGVGPLVAELAPTLLARLAGA
jgi:DNA repair protein SbcD/Mre11